MYFYQLHSSAILLYKNLHGHMLLIFIPIIFLRKHHLLIDKQKDHISIKFTASLLFFLGRECQHKIIKIGITILSLPQLKLYILQDCKQFKSIYLASFNSPRKISEIVHFIFLSNTTLHEESNKIWLTQFDTPTSRYHFPKLA